MYVHIYKYYYDTAGAFRRILYEVQRIFIKKSILGKEMTKQLVY